MRDDGMQDQPCPARLPVRRGGMGAQAGDMGPGLAGVIAAEQSGGLDAGVDAAVAAGEAPDRLDRLLVRGIGDPLAGMGPFCPEVGGLPDRGAEPLIATAGIDRAGFRVSDDVVHRPGFAERAAQRPIGSRCVAFQGEGALLGSEQDENARWHDFSSLRGARRSWTNALMSTLNAMWL